MADPVYKLVPAALWQEVGDDGFFHGSELDRKDGFIHLSTASQAPVTAGLYFRGVADLWLLKIDSAVLGDALVYEPSRDNALFPHLYAALPLSAILWRKPLPLAADGTHIFPELA